MEFPLDAGVLQGCPASPLVFSLYMDRLEAFVMEALASWPAADREDVWVIGVLVPLLLFADDLVLLAQSARVAMRLLDLLSAWCCHMGLTVSLTKTKWLVGGFSSVQRSDFVDPAAGVTLRYRDTVLERVSDFKYLGLKVTGSAGMGAMIDARLAAARKVWTWLVGMVTQWGWRDRATRLLLLDMYVCSSLLYGAATWGVDLVAVDGDLTRDRSGTIGVFYRGLLRATLGLHHRARNEVVYVLSGRLPVSLYIGKVLIRYCASL